MPSYRIHSRKSAGVVEFRLPGQPKAQPDHKLEHPQQFVSVELRSDKAAKAIERRLDGKVRVGRASDTQADWRAAAKAGGAVEHVRVRVRATLPATIDKKKRRVPTTSIHVVIPDDRRVYTMRPDSPPLDVRWNSAQRAAVKASGALGLLDVTPLAQDADGNWAPKKRKAKKAAKKKRAKRKAKKAKK